MVFKEIFEFIILYNKYCRGQEVPVNSWPVNSLRYLVIDSRYGYDSYLFIKAKLSLAAINAWHFRSKLAILTTLPWLLPT